MLTQSKAVRTMCTICTWGPTMPPSPLAVASVISRDTAHSSSRAGIGAEANKDPNILEQVPIHLVHTDATISLPKLGRWVKYGPMEDELCAMIPEAEWFWLLSFYLDICVGNQTQLNHI